MTKIYFSILFSIFAIHALAADYGRFKTEPITLIEDGVEIHGVRILNPNGQPNVKGDPLILTHGLSSNWHEFEEIIPELMRGNKDVFAFNWRFHGNGAERSVDRGFRNGDDIFNEMALKDFPMMLDHIMSVRPNRKIQLIGHSMGGMVPRASLILGTSSSEIIDKMVLIGSPAKFRDKQFPILERLGLKRFMRFHLNLGNDLDPAYVKSDLRLIQRLSMLNPLYWLGGKAVVSNVIRNHARAEMGPVVDEPGYSDRTDSMITDRLPKKILREFDEFSRKYHYENIPIDDVQILHIAGEKDKLAPWKDIYEGAQIQSSKPGFWFILVRGIGHFGIVSKWTISRYIDDVFKFFDKPTSIGPKNKTFIQIDPDRSGKGGISCLSVYQSR